MLWNGDYLSCSTYPVDQQDDSCDFFFDWLTQDIGKNRNDAVSDQQTNKQTTLNVSQLVLKLTHSLWVNLTHFESTSLTLSHPNSISHCESTQVTIPNYNCESTRLKNLSWTRQTSFWVLLIYFISKNCITLFFDAIELYINAYQRTQYRREFAVLTGQNYWLAGHGNQNAFKWLTYWVVHRVVDCMSASRCRMSAGIGSGNWPYRPIL